MPRALIVECPATITTLHAAESWLTSRGVTGLEHLDVEVLRSPRVLASRIRIVDWSGEVQWLPKVQEGEVIGVIRGDQLKGTCEREGTD